MYVPYARNPTTSIIRIDERSTLAVKPLNQLYEYFPDFKLALGNLEKEVRFADAVVILASHLPRLVDNHELDA